MINQKGITLAELMITTVIVGVVMLGVVAADRALQQGERSSSRSAMVNMRVNAIMANITKNASLAIGTDSQRGICISSPLGGANYHAYCGVGPDITNIANANTNYICFHQDFNPNTAGFVDPLDQALYRGTPDNFADDRWVCYTRRKANISSPSELFTCIVPFAAWPQACQNTDTNLGIVADDTFSDTDPGPRDTTPKFIINQVLPVLPTDPSTALAFEVTIRSIYDPLRAVDRNSNPMVELTSRVSPDGHGF